MGGNFTELKEKQKNTEVLAKETSQQLQMHNEKIVPECAIPHVIYFRPFPAGESARRYLGDGGLDLHCEAG